MKNEPTNKELSVIFLFCITMFIIVGFIVNKQIETTKINCISTIRIALPDSTMPHAPVGSITVTDSSIQYIDKNGFDVHMQCLSDVTITATFGERGVYSFPVESDTTNAPAQAGKPRI